MSVAWLSPIAESEAGVCRHADVVDLQLRSLLVRAVCCCCYDRVLQVVRAVLTLQWFVGPLARCGWW